MKKLPRSYEAFIKRFPRLGEAWEEARKAEEEGPFDARVARLVKLGVAMRALREGAVHSAVRKARAAGATRAEIEHVVALAASTVGFPAAVALHSWCLDTLDAGASRR
jgi:alkylhydroperoxidase/carboxymuconolactone decarboxylase family protein YurZ